jgi:hypothetical protein
VLLLVGSVVGLLTIDFDDDSGVAAGPGDTTTTEVPATTPTSASTPTTVAGTSPTTGATAGTSATTSATTATTVATTAATSATTVTTSTVGGSTVTTAPGTGLGATGGGQAGQNPLATSGGEDMIGPAILLALAGWMLHRLARRAAL